VQRKTGWALGDALRMAFLLMKDGGGRYSGGGKSIYAEVKAADIPDSLEIEVNMDVALPQDRLQMASIVNQLRGIMPTEWLLENIFQVRQPGQMVEQAMSEQVFQAMFQAYVQKKIMEQQQPPPQMQAPQGGMPMMGGAPNETMSLPPSMGGLPPEMGMFGGQGPQAPAGAPNEGEYGL
jgi:hypothetical protein